MEHVNLSKKLNTKCKMQNAKCKMTTWAKWKVPTWASAQDEQVVHNWVEKGDGAPAILLRKIVIMIIIYHILYILDIIYHILWSDLAIFQKSNFVFFLSFWQPLDSIYTLYNILRGSQRHCLWFGRGWHSF